ncbi:MAG: ABC transporter permease [Proteobacteria bacterium]|nr:ABC transporter permease [Pseudomonadota bacterium]
MSLDLILAGLTQGLILAIIAYAIMVPFRLLNFADLTAEGAYPVGGAVCASCLYAGLSAPLAILFGTLAAGSMGVAVGLLHLRLKVNTLLAGIILSTMAYSVNLRILGKPNVALFNTVSIFPSNNQVQTTCILVAFLSACLIPLALVLRTDIGLRLRAVGLNQGFAQQQGISIVKYTLFGLFTASCLSGLAGGLMVQMQSYMDVTMGVGIVIHGLAALMIGETLLGMRTMSSQLAAPLIGALIYQQIQGFALTIGLAPSDLKLFTGMIVILVILIRENTKWCR